MSPGRNPRLSPASTAGRARMIRLTRRLVSASTAAATARYVFPVPAAPIPTTMSFSWMSLRYVACPGVLGWMMRRTPGSTMRRSPPMPPAPLPPSPTPSSLRRSTSSGSSGTRCFAASTIRCATGVARSTSSSGPVSVSVSPRSDTFTPAMRASSMRLASLTPASVSRSAPSVEMRWTTASSLIRRPRCAARAGPRPAPASARSRTARARPWSWGTR